MREKGVLRSSTTVQKKFAEKLTQESTNTLLQMELKARPGPGSMGRKPQN